MSVKLKKDRKVMKCIEKQLNLVNSVKQFLVIF